MTTTAFDDQFVSATETILALNVRDECRTPFQVKEWMIT